MAEPDRRDFLGGMAVGGLTGAAATGLGVSVIDWGRSLPASKYPNLDHDRYMRLAIVQAKKAEYKFGAAIVDGPTGKVVAEGYNRTAVNPTYHGEIYAINRCAELHPGIDWKQLVLYTTAEPCSMCQSAIEWAGIAETVFGTSIGFLQSHGWQQIDIPAAEVIRRTPFQQTALRGGVLEAECNELYIHAPPRFSTDKK